MSESNRLNNAALSFMDSKRPTALAMLRRSVSIDPNPHNQCNLAIALTSRGEYDEASQILRKLIDANPQNIAVWHAYGVLSLVAGYPGDAAASFNRCMLLDPGNGDMTFDYSLALMQAGLWREGLEAYDVRRQWKAEKVYGDLPFWNGEKDKTVYVWAEQGIGDTIQFARYIPWLASISKRVILALPHSLIGLFEGFKAVCEIVTLTTDVEGIEYGTGMMSLARQYELTHGTVFAPIINNFIRGGFPERDDRLKIGIAWACNPSSGHFKERSIPFGDILQLTANRDVDLVSLQVGDAAADISIHGAQTLVRDLSPDIGDDWCKTGAAMQCLDLVVTTDTSVAHLAASLGKPTIMFLARRDWWRWGNAGPNTPWYPSMRIIRAEKPFAWGNEIKLASQIIDSMIADRSQAKAA